LRVIFRRPHGKTEKTQRSIKYKRTETRRGIIGVDGGGGGRQSRVSYKTNVISTIVITGVAAEG
jgi:hypothetical protein